ncbi:uncharacterized protein LOC132619129 [Lycium barbarum]|uniref:uncharacterized protein LOC132619129 n=1 Tax=Lycium barbarum TaxID=112863 RepID=UPI00293E2176|nr:uncharacterized protein LOC132619129 [Lycium barbarum]
MSQASCSSQECALKRTCLLGLVANYFTAYTLENGVRGSTKVSDLMMKSQADVLKFEQQKFKKNLETMEVINQLEGTKSIKLEASIDVVNLERDILMQKVKEMEATNQIQRTKAVKLEEELLLMKAIIMISWFLFACIFSLLV